MNDSAQRLAGQFPAHLMVFGTKSESEHADMLLMAEVTVTIDGFTEIAFTHGVRRYYLRFRNSAYESAREDMA